MSTIERAIVIATQAHDGQVDKAGEPYILHPLRVMLAMKSKAGRIVGVLHDVAEDCPDWSMLRIRNEGFERDIEWALGFLTRQAGEPYSQYIDRLCLYGTPLARAVKIRDLQDNYDLGRLNRLPVADAERLGARYHAAFQALVRTEPGEF